MLNKLFRLFYPAQSFEEIKRQYNIPDELSIKIRFTDDGYFVLTSDELPGLITEAKDGRELIKMFNEAVLSYYDVPKRIGDVIYNKMNIDGHGTFLIEADNKALQTA